MSDTNPCTVRVEVIVNVYPCDCCIPDGARITEDGAVRLTQDNAIRVVEEAA